MFADRAKILIRSGKGGDGPMSVSAESFLYRTAGRTAAMAAKAETLFLKLTKD